MLGMLSLLGKYFMLLDRTELKLGNEDSVFEVLNYLEKFLIITSWEFRALIMNIDEFCKCFYNQI